MFEAKNYTDVFSRNVIVGISSFLYDVINIIQIEKGVAVVKRVPFFYSLTGDEQFIQDHFLDGDRYCNVLSPKIDGNITRIPSGVFTFSSVGINQQDLGSGYTRVEYTKEFDTEFSKEVRDMSSRADFIPIQYDFEATIKCGSDIERLKIMDEIWDKLYKVKKFTIKYRGFDRLPVSISFPEKYDINKNFKFRFSQEDKRPLLVMQLQIVAYKPVIDEKTERFVGERIDNFTYKFAVKPIVDDNNIDHIDPNDSFKI